MDLHRVFRDGEHRRSSIRVEMFANGRSGTDEMPSCVPRAEADLRVCKCGWECVVVVRATGEVPLFPCQEVDDLAAVEVRYAELLAGLDGEGEPMACFDGGGCHAR